MTALRLDRLPAGLRVSVVQERYFAQAFSAILFAREPWSMIEQALELRTIAANAFLVFEDAKHRVGNHEAWQDVRTAAIQALAASVGASLLDDAVIAIRRGERDRLVLLADIKRTLSEIHQPVDEATSTETSVPQALAIPR